MSIANFDVNHLNGPTNAMVLGLIWYNGVCGVAVQFAQTVRLAVV